MHHVKVQLIISFTAQTVVRWWAKDNVPSHGNLLCQPAIISCQLSITALVWERLAKSNVRVSFKCSKLHQAMIHHRPIICYLCPFLVYSTAFSEVSVLMSGCIKGTCRSKYRTMIERWKRKVRLLNPQEKRPERRRNNRREAISNYVGQKT